MWYTFRDHYEHIVREDFAMTRNDMDRFWADDAAAHGQNCFDPAAPQMALGILMSDECVFAELGEEGEPWGHTPRERRIDLNRRYNDIAEKVVGRRLLREELPPEDAAFPPVRRIGEVFGGAYEYIHDSEWLSSPIDTPEALAKQLDAVERLDLRAFLLPDNWQAEKKRIFETYGIRPPQARHIRGPITLMCSIYGSESFIFLAMDEPELAERFSRLVAKVAIGIAEVFDEEAGYTPDTAPRGFSFADDNCCLMTPALYERLGLPVLEAAFARFAPDDGDSRFQHSDSAMGHLLPLLGRARLNGVNFGPTVTVDQIRPHLPDARVDGCLSPIDFMRNDRPAILEQLKRDAQMAREHGYGVNFATAGSINNGSLLSSMAFVMEGIAEHGRYR